MLDSQKLVGSGPVQPVRWLRLCTSYLKHLAFHASWSFLNPPSLLSDVSVTFHCEGCIIIINIWSIQPMKDLCCPEVVLWCHKRPYDAQNFNIRVASLIRLKIFLFRKSVIFEFHIYWDGSFWSWNPNTRKTHLLPPRFFLATSIGAGSGFNCLTGGGSCNLSSLCSISKRRASPTVPSWDSWKLSTRAARLHFADTKRAAFLLNSFNDCS